MFNHVLRKCTVLNCMEQMVRCSFRARNFSQDNRYVHEVHLRMQEEAQEKLKEYRQSSEENEKTYKLLELEIDVMRYDGLKVPSILKPVDWLSLVKMRSGTEKKRYLEYRWKVEMKKINHQEKVKEKMSAKEVKENKDNKEDNWSGLEYGLQHNHMFIRLQQTAMNNWYNSRLISGMLFEQNIVFDCSYECMSPKEIKSCAKQLMYAFASNRIHPQPLNLHLCNANPRSPLLKNLNCLIPPLYDSDFPLNVRSESYLDIFKKEDLIYLTPHVYEEAKEFNPEAVYIIGALVDKSQPGPVSMAKAKREGIRMQRLPLDIYLDWGSGSGKNLTLNQVLDILLDYRYTKDWKHAFRHVPTRKLREARDDQTRRRLNRLGVRMEVKK